MSFKCEVGFQIRTPVDASDGRHTAVYCKTVRHTVVLSSSVVR